MTDKDQVLQATLNSLYVIGVGALSIAFLIWIIFAKNKNVSAGPSLRAIVFFIGLIPTALVVSLANFTIDLFQGYGLNPLMGILTGIMTFPLILPVVFFWVAFSAWQFHPSSKKRFLFGHKEYTILAVFFAFILWGAAILWLEFVRCDRDNIIISSLRLEVPAECPYAYKPKNQ